MTTDEEVMDAELYEAIEKAKKGRRSLNSEIQATIIMHRNNGKLLKASCGHNG